MMKNKENIINKILSDLKYIVEAHLCIQEQPLYLDKNTTLTPREMRTIEIIGKLKNINVKELGDYLNISKSAASQMISKLSKKGFARKENPVDNNKELILHLTELGQRAFYLQQQLHNQHISSLIQSLTLSFQNHELENTSKILQLIKESMNKNMSNLMKK